MVTLIKYGALSGGVKYNINQMWICGLSTDTKPTTKIDGMGIPNGSVYTEVDTGKTYMFDYDNATWYEVAIGGGGGGTQGGIVLVGETTTALTDWATTNPITVDGQSYTAQANDAVIYLNKEFLFDGTKWHEFGDLSGLASKDIGAMTGYAKAQSASAIAATDTLNEAVGKLEKKADDNTSALSSKQNQVLGSWTAGTAISHVTPTGTDTVLEALQKIDNNQRNDENDISTLQGKVKAHSEGGTDYDVINGIRVYVSATAPTGDIPTGSLWIGG